MTTAKQRDPDRHVLREAAAETPACLPLERLGEPLSDVEQAHVASCARCQSELALRAEFEDSVTAPDERLAVQWIGAELRRRTHQTARAPSWGHARHGRGLLAAAAGLVLVASLGYLAWDREPGLQAPGTTAPIERGGRIDALLPAGDVGRAPEAFSWAPVDGASSYEVTVMEVDRTVLWRESSSVPRVAPPATLKRRLVPGKTMLWTVIARNAAGVVIAESSTARFRVAPAPPGD